MSVDVSSQPCTSLTLRDVSRLGQKPGHRTTGHWLARRWARPLAVPGAWLAIRLGISAHAVTLMALATDLLGAVAIGTGTRGGFILGVLMLHVGYWLDHVDGQVARATGRAGITGRYLDYWMHQASVLTLGFGLGFGLAQATGDLFLSLAGFAAGAGWLLLRLHDDCMAKAVLDCMRADEDRPSPLTFAPVSSQARPCTDSQARSRRAGRLALIACEPQNVLVSLTVLLLTAAFLPGAWRGALTAFVLGHALLAPALALLRLGRRLIEPSGPNRPGIREI